MDDKCLNLLCVEDDPADARLLKNIVDSLGWSATYATNGLDGYAFAQTKRFDVIVTNQTMPDLPGLGLFKCVRTGHGPNSATPFLLNSRSFTSEIIELVLKFKVEAVVEKPLLKSHLKDQLLRLSRGQSAANDVTAPTFGVGDIRKSLPSLRKLSGLM